MNYLSPPVFFATIRLHVASVDSVMSVDLLNHIIDEIHVFTSFFAFLMAVGQLLTRNKEWHTYIVFLVYFSFGMVNLDLVYQIDGTISKYPHLLGIAWPFHFFVMPAVYLYIKKLVSRNYKPTLVHYSFFLPGILNVLILIPLIYMKGVDEKIIFSDQVYNLSGGSLPSVIFITGFLFKVIFVGLTLKEISFMCSREGLRESGVFRTIMFLYFELLVAFSISTVGFLNGNYLLLRINTLVFDQIIMMPLFLSFRYPNILHNLSVDISRVKYRQSQVNGLNVSTVIVRLKELLQIEKIFTNPELNIGIVSEKLNISSHQLSEIINREMKMNFRSLVNACRIKEAKKMLLDDPDETVLKIAYSVGFNSKTSFNNAFAALNKMTPTEFRKKNSK